MLNEKIYLKAKMRFKNLIIHAKNKANKTIEKKYIK